MLYSSSIEKIKILLNIDIEDNSKNFLLDILGNQSINMIKKYLNHEKYNAFEIKDKYEDALVCCVVDLYNNLENKNGTIQSMTQGQRSISYNNSSSTELSDRVKSMLPLPRMRLL